MIRLAAVPVIVASLLVAAPAAADEEPIESAGRASDYIAVDHDGDRVLFSSATRNIDPLVDARAPQGTYLWTPSSLGRVEQLGNHGVDVTPDGRTAVINADQTYVFAVDGNVGLEQVSVSTSGEGANTDVCCSGPSISADGRYVAFTSQATNLGGGGPGLFLRDRVERTTTRLAAGWVYAPELSLDGGTIAYDLDDTVHVRDLPDGAVERLPGDTGGSIVLSADGDTVAYSVYEADEQSFAVVIHDRTTGTDIRIDDAGMPSISADGTRVAYHGGERPLHVYVRDLTTGETTRLSDPPGAPADGVGGGYPEISGDGTKVVFVSSVTGLVPGVVHAPVGNDVFMADVESGELTLLTVGRDAGLHHLRADGFVNSYGAAQPRTPMPRLDGAVAIATPTFRDGFWVTNTAGRVARAGHAQSFGEITMPLARPVVDIASSRSGRGYWLTASDGGVFSFGDATYFGSTGALRLNRPIVGMTPTPSGEGYWLVASDGGVFSFGDARFLGSTGAMRLNRPIVGMARTPTGRGYWLVASDGGIFTFGDATFHGSTGAIALNQPIVAIVRTHAGRGYRLVAADGGVFAFGDASHIWGPSDPRCCILDAAGA